MQYGKICIMSVLLASLAACTTPSNNQQYGAQAQPPLVRSANANSPNFARADNRVVTGTYAQTGDTGFREQNVSSAPIDNNAQQTTQLSTSMPATAQPTQQPVRVAQAPARVTSSGPGISTNLSYAQAWEKVGKALPAAGYPVMEQDSSSGTYYVLDKSSTGGTIKRDTPIYQVRIQRQGNTSSINVLNAQNQPADAGVSSRILGSLKNQIS